MENQWQVIKRITWSRKLTEYRGAISWWFEYRPDWENASVPYSSRRIKVNIVCFPRITERYGKDISKCKANLAAGHAQNRHRRRINMAQLGQEECRAKKSNTLHNLKSKKLKKMFFKQQNKRFIQSMRLCIMAYKLKFWNFLVI